MTGWWLLDLPDSVARSGTHTPGRQVVPFSTPLHQINLDQSFLRGWAFMPSEVVFFLKSGDVPVQQSTKGL